MIEVNDVSKKFRIWEDRSRDLKETAINLLRGKKRTFRDLWALRGIDVKIKEGETVAFIGENGSGKSTLLKLLGGIYTPDEGKIVTRGRISTLLELGVGFHPDLTGEENIYLNGAMLGFDRAEMRERFDEIVSFSEIGEFVYSPIRTYSSGMLMRLGFSVAMCVNPDILLLDEVLAVGDEAFQEKCFERLGGYKTSGKTIVLVSHGMDLVRKFCDRAILLHEGRVVTDGDPEEVVDAYHTLLSRRGKKTGSELPEKEDLPSPADVEGIPRSETIAAGLPIQNECSEECEDSEKDARTALENRSLREEKMSAQPALSAPASTLREMKITDPQGVEKKSFQMEETVNIRIIVETKGDGEPAIGIGIVRRDLVPIYGVSTLMDHVKPVKIGDHLYSILCEFQYLKLLPGNYIVRGHCGDPSGKLMFDTVEKNLTITGETEEFGLFRLRHRWKALHD